MNKKDCRAEHTFRISFDNYYKRVELLYWQNNTKTWGFSKAVGYSYFDDEKKGSIESVIIGWVIDCNNIGADVIIADEGGNEIKLKASRF